jgi:hypothetical protein
MLRIPYCLDSRLTDGGEVVRLTHRPRSSPQKHSAFVSVTRFCYRLSKLQSLVRLEGLGTFIKIIYPIGSRTHDLPACSVVSFQTA